MPPKIRELKARLRRAGFTSRSGKGSHTFWFHAEIPATKVTVAGSDGNDARPYQEREVQDAIQALEDRRREGVQ